jgi:hypothetical protein
VGEGHRVEKWPKQCMHMWINEFKKLKAEKRKKNRSRVYIFKISLRRDS